MGKADKHRRGASGASDVAAGAADGKPGDGEGGTMRTAKANLRGGFAGVTLRKGGGACAGRGEGVWCWCCIGRD